LLPSVAACCLLLQLLLLQLQLQLLLLLHLGLHNGSTQWLPECTCPYLLPQRTLQQRCGGRVKAYPPGCDGRV
jgi:hypothetical protein